MVGPFVELVLLMCSKMTGSFVVLFVLDGCSALFLELQISTMFIRLIYPAGQGSRMAFI